MKMQKEIYYFGKAELVKRVGVDYYHFDKPDEDLITDQMMDDLMKSVDIVFIGTENDLESKEMARSYRVPFIADTNLKELERFYSSDHYQAEVRFSP